VRIRKAEKPRILARESGACPCTPRDLNPEPTDSGFVWELTFWEIVNQIEVSA
jgi:hypothetical protein